MYCVCKVLGAPTSFRNCVSFDGYVVTCRMCLFTQQDCLETLYKSVSWYDNKIIDQMFYIHVNET